MCLCVIVRIIKFSVFRSYLILANFPFFKWKIKKKEKKNGRYNNKQKKNMTETRSVHKSIIYGAHHHRHFTNCKRFQCVSIRIMCAKQKMCCALVVCFIIDGVLCSYCYFLFFFLCVYLCCHQYNVCHHQSIYKSHICCPHLSVKNCRKYTRLFISTCTYMQFAQSSHNYVSFNKSYFCLFVCISISIKIIFCFLSQQ